MIEVSMGQRILVTIDGSEQSEKALRYAVDQYPDAEFILMHVIHGHPGHYFQMGKSGYSSTEEYEDEYEETEELLSSLEERIVPAGTTVSTTIESGEPTRTIVSYTAENDIDLIVLGSHGRSGASRVLLGSVAESVTRRSSVPVLIVR